MSAPTSEDLVRLGRIALASLAGYVLIVGFLYLRPPALPVGHYDERGHDRSGDSMAWVSLEKPDLDAETVGTLAWYRSDEGPASRKYSMRRHGKSEDGYRYDLYSPDRTEPVGYVDHDGAWLVITLAASPSQKYSMKSDQPTWSSWAE